MQEALQTLIEKINANQKIAKSNQTAILDMDDKLKRTIQQMIGLQQLKISQNHMIKHFQELEVKLEEQKLINETDNTRFKDLREEMDTKF